MTVKRIAQAQLRVGMYVHRLDGSWLEHPFWKKAFAVRDTATIHKIAASGVQGVWIDTARGRDVDAPPEEDHEATALATAIAADDRGPSPAPQSPCSLADEIERARRVVDQSRAAMKRMFEEVRLGRAIDTEHCLPLVADITGSIERNRHAIVSLARLKTSDDYTYMHSVAVCALMIALGRQWGCEAGTVRELGVAGLVHDLGKMAMPPEILNKRGALTAAEFAVMRGHPSAGHAMLAASGGFGETSLDVCLHHHEKVNGGGYPEGLAGERISLAARMGAVCDVYDAITSTRCYKPGWDPAGSIREMAKWTNEGHFDDAVFQAFVKSVGIYPTGSLVRLASNRLAVVVDASSGNLLRPVVRAVLAVETRAMIDDIVDLSVPGCDDRIVAREDPAHWSLTGLDDLWSLPA